jgi:hypothetical protein
MNKLSLALATTAIAATSSAFISTAQAGGRGVHFHLFQMQLQRQAYQAQEEEAYIRHRRALQAHRQIKQYKQVKQVEKPAEKAPVIARYIDGKGRQFDLVSKVWFDGSNRCWMGDKPFVFKAGSWFYGDAKWIEADDSWRAASGQAPEQVSCDGIKAFAGKLQNGEIKQVAVEKVEPKKVEPKVEKAEVKPVEKNVATTTTTATTTTATAKAAECKKYFPSVGEMVSVPCNQ